GTLLPATSNAFVVTAGAPVGLAFAIQPTYTDRNPITRFIRNPDPKQPPIKVDVPLTINEYNPNAGVPNTWNGVVVQAVDRFGNAVRSGLQGTVTMTTDGRFNKQNPDRNIPDATTEVPLDPDTQVAAFTNLVWQQNKQAPATFGKGSMTARLDPAPSGGLKVGDTVSGKGIQPGTTITSFNDEGRNTATIGLSLP